MPESTPKNPHRRRKAEPRATRLGSTNRISTGTKPRARAAGQPIAAQDRKFANVHKALQNNAFISYDMKRRSIT